ncbi:hypothetical protein [Streptomyces sp. GESEQ-4]|uniref:hypothetical protein n=1 Tax=Streptomyces sp. GESEQ-4 TaxID=2812655 RepID=UPI0035A96080
MLQVAALWLPLAAAASAVTGIAVAAYRRRALTATALGTALGGAFLALTIEIGRRLTLAHLPEDAHHPATSTAYDALTTTLRTVSWLLVALGLTVALTCHLVRRRRASATPAPDPAQERTRARA